MIENIKEREKDIREIWTEHRDEMPLKEIFIMLVPEFYNMPSEAFGFKGFADPDWRHFNEWVKTWRKEEHTNRLENLSKNLTPEGAQKMLETGRRRAIVLFNDIIIEWQKNPKKIRNTQLKELISFYNTIQQSEDRAERTRIAAKKEKRETVGMLLPYLDLSAEELKELKVRLDESLARVITIKEGQESEGAKQLPAESGVAE